jgi:nucleoside-diphosphate-sugar epimerase
VTNGFRDPIAVTGGSGFVGANIVRELAGAGLPVLSLDLETPLPDLRAVLASLPGSVEHVQADVTDAASLPARRLGAVVHAAAVTAVPLDERIRFQRLAAVNVLGTANVVEWASLNGAKRFVQISSSSVYGATPQTQPVTEDRAPAPVSAYAVTKLAGESLVLRFGDLTGLDVRVVRLTSPFGPFERPTRSSIGQSAIFEWVLAASSGKEVEMGDPSSSRDWIYSKDAARAISAILGAQAVSERIYNVSSGVATTNAEAWTILHEIFPSARAQWGSVGSNANFAPGFVRGPLDMTRFVQAFGFRPSADLASGIRDYLRSAPPTRG